MTEFDRTGQPRSEASILAHILAKQIEIEAEIHSTRQLTEEVRGLLLTIRDGSKATTGRVKDEIMFTLQQLVETFGVARTNIREVKQAVERNTSRLVLIERAIEEGEAAEQARSQAAASDDIFSVRGNE